MMMRDDDLTEEIFSCSELHTEDEEDHHPDGDRCCQIERENSTEPEPVSAGREFDDDPSDDDLFCAVSNLAPLLRQRYPSSAPAPVLGHALSVLLARRFPHYYVTLSCCDRMREGVPRILSPVPPRWYQDVAVVRHREHGMSCLVVDFDFRSKFLLAPSPHPAGRLYAEYAQHFIPDVFVGTPRELARHVGTHARNMTTVFAATGRVLPPWRSATTLHKFYLLWCGGIRRTLGSHPEPPLSVSSVAPLPLWWGRTRLTLASLLYHLWTANKPLLFLTSLASTSAETPRPDP